MKKNEICLDKLILKEIQQFEKDMREAAEELRKIENHEGEYKVYDDVKSFMEDLSKWVKSHFTTWQDLLKNAKI